MSVFLICIDSVQCKQIHLWKTNLVCVTWTHSVRTNDRSSGAHFSKIQPLFPPDVAASLGWLAVCACPDCGLVNVTALVGGGLLTALSELRSCRYPAALVFQFTVGASVKIFKARISHFIFFYFSVGKMMMGIQLLLLKRTILWMISSIR